MAVAEKRLHSIRFRIDALDLVIVGVGDIEHPGRPGDSERMLQARLFADAVPIAEFKQAATARQIGGAHDG